MQKAYHIISFEGMVPYPKRKLLIFELQGEILPNPLKVCRILFLGRPVITIYKVQK